MGYKLDYIYDWTNMHSSKENMKKNMKKNMKSKNNKNKYGKF